MAVASLIVRVSAQIAEHQKSFADATRTQQKFERDFANTASSVSAQQKRINDAFSSFSGDKIARDATAVAKAVEQIGGASKLTAGEQARVNAVVGEAIAKYNALGQSAPKALTDLEHATRRVEAATSEIPKKLTLADKAAGLLAGTFGQFTAANLASNAITGIVSKLGEFIVQGERLPAISGSFSRLSASVGQSSADILSAMQTGTRGLVSNLDLMQSANKAILLGLPVTSQSIGELADAATKLGRAMGLDAKQSIDDLITALGRSSPLILDNLGLTVKVGEANELYAKRLGKTVEQLTEAEKKTAFYEAAMEAARRKSIELGETTLTLSDRFNQAWTSIGNVVAATSSTLNTGIGRATSSFREFGLFVQDIAKVGIAQAALNASIREQIAQSAAVSKKASSEAGAAQRNYVKEIEHAIDTMPALTKAGLAQYQAALKLKATTEELTAQFGLSVLQQQLMAEKMAATARAANAAAPSIKKVAEATKELAVVGPKVVDGLSRAFEDVGRQAKLAIPDIAKMFAIIHAGMPTPTNGIVGSTLPGMAVPLTDVVGDMKRMADASARASHELDDLFRSIGQVGDALGGEFGSTLANVAQGWLAASDAVRAYQNATTLAGKASAAIQGGMAVWEAAGAESRTSATLGAAATGMKLGMAIAGPYGAAVGAVAGAIVGLVRSAGQGREAVEAFAKSFGGFDGLREKLNKLGDEGERLWVNLTQGVGKNNTQQAAVAIAAIQEALAKSTAVDDAIAASGFKTRKQLEELATTAKAVYERMRDSGEFSAKSVQEAFKRMQEAQMDAFGDSTATDSLKARLQELDTEFNTLFKSIENEAQEEVMGIIEAQARERMKAIESERIGVESEMDKVTKAVEDNLGGLGGSAEKAARSIEEALNGITIQTIRIPIEIPGISSLGSGGIVRRPTLALIGESGPEAVVPLGQLGHAGGGGSSPGNVYMDGRIVGEIVEEHMDRRLRGRIKVSA